MRLLYRIAGSVNGKVLEDAVRVVWSVSLNTPHKKVQRQWVLFAFLRLSTVYTSRVSVGNRVNLGYSRVHRQLRRGTQRGFGVQVGGDITL